MTTTSYSATLASPAFAWALTAHPLTHHVYPYSTRGKDPPNAWNNAAVSQSSLHCSNRHSRMCGCESRQVSSTSIHADVRVGHVHLRVADLDRAIAFYRDGL